MRLIGYLVPSSHYVLLALLFFAGLETLYSLRRWLLPLSALLLLVMALGIILVRIEERDRFRTTQAILPVLAVIGLASFSLFLPTTNLIHLYFAMASLLLFWLLKHGAKLAYPTWNWTLSTIVLFLDTAAILGLRFHLEHFVPLLVGLGAIFLVSFLISFQAIRRVADLLSDALLISFATAMALTEVAWTLQFLPLHYVVQAGTLVVCYYVFFHLISVSYERRLQRKDITEYIAVGAVALILILVTARWK